MANYRIPGPMCTTKNPWSIDDGTLKLCLTPPPGPICAESFHYPSKALQCLQEKKSTEPDLGFLFRQCLNPKRGLTEEDYSAAATQLKVEVAAIKAVAEVETTGNAFDEEGRPRILFERHYFHRLNGQGIYFRFDQYLRQFTCQAGAWRSYWERQAPAWRLDRRFCAKIDGPARYWRRYY